MKHPLLFFRGFSIGGVLGGLPWLVINPSPAILIWLILCSAVVIFTREVKQ